MMGHSPASQDTEGREECIIENAASPWTNIPQAAQPEDFPAR